MKKTIIMTMIALMSFVCIPTMAMDNVEISVQQSSVTVNGAVGSTMEIISLTGRKVVTVKIDSPSQRVDLNLPKGCYIIKIDNPAKKESHVRKVTIG